MRKKLTLSLICLVLLACLNACAAIPWGMEAVTWLDQDQILFQDTFTDPHSGWEESKSVTELKGYSQDGYLFSVMSPNSRSWSRLGLWLGNIQLTSSARNFDGDDNSRYGLVCRYVDKDNYYAFLIGADASYTILRVVDGKETLLAEMQGNPNDGILTADGRNKLTAGCIGAELSLVINGQEVLSAQDTRLRTGDVGLMLQTGGDGGASVLFNTFEITKK